VRYPLTIPPGIVGDDTSFSEKGRWGACSMVRFRLGKPQVDGGWESLIEDLLTGVCRMAFPFRDNGGVLNIGFGTHSKLQLWQGGALYDITPYGPPRRLGSAPFSDQPSTTVTVTDTAHGIANGTSCIIAGAAGYRRHRGGQPQRHADHHRHRRGSLQLRGRSRRHLDHDRRRNRCGDDPAGRARGGGGGWHRNRRLWHRRLWRRPVGRDAADPGLFPAHLGDWRRGARTCSRAQGAGASTNGRTSRPPGLSPSPTRPPR
jgi:hypothetical protein